ncbi:unnamed protein product [Schistosoma curassoni]|uniref:Secreted protein n=1 Tax=Schistosoma curassoni TaxID=6186 RepID=A0A183KSN8_9TREM|nr:unnamed protein product [Schistosoma curassoni]
MLVGSFFSSSAFINPNTLGRAGGSGKNDLRVFESYHCSLVLSNVTGSLFLCLNLKR